MGVAVFSGINFMTNSNSGVYQLRISVGKTCSILIGKLGNFTFPTGKFVYTGRAKKTYPRELIGIKNKIRNASGILIIY